MKLTPVKKDRYEDVYRREISSVPLFARCSARDLHRIARWSSRVTVPAGRLLAVQGRNADQFLVLLSGEAVVRYPLGRSELIGPGDHVGEVDLLAHAPSCGTVEAETDIDVLAFDSRHFRSLLDSSPLVVRRLATDLARRLWTELGFLGDPDARPDWARR